MDNQSFSLAVVSIFLASGVLMIGASNPPYSMSNESVDSFPFWPFGLSFCSILDLVAMSFGRLEAPVVHSTSLRLDYLMM